MRSLRGRLFIAILCTVLVGVGAALALGVVLTKDAVRGTIRRDLERQADAFASQFERLPEVAGRALKLPPGPRLPPGAPPPGEPQPVRVLTPAAARRELPAAVPRRRSGAVSRRAKSAATAAASRAAAPLAINSAER